MICYEITVNGERKCTAGIATDGVVSVHIGHVLRDGTARRSPDLSVGGLDSETQEHLRWTQQQVIVGDSILVRVVDVERSDPPLKRYKRDETGQA